MDDDFTPLELPEILIPVPLRAELHMAGGTFWSDDRYLRFRVDPGRAFELHGFLLDTGNDRYHTSFSQRYRPDRQMTCVTAGTGITADTIPDHLRHAVAHAKRLVASRPLWHQTTKPTPEWSMAWPAEIPDIALHVRDTVAGRARDTRITHFAYLEQERIVCSANPPAAGLFFSATPQGHWSAHEGPVTFPLDFPPSTELFGLASAHNPARLAAGDQPRAHSAAVPHVAPATHEPPTRPAKPSARFTAGRGR